LRTPAQVHPGRTGRGLAARRTVLALAYAALPARFVRGAPQPTAPPDAVWINPPAHSGIDAADDVNLSASLPDAAPVGGYPADGSRRSPGAPDAP
jgi:hypothetical protein